MQGQGVQCSMADVDTALSIHKDDANQGRCRPYLGQLCLGLLALEGNARNAWRATMHPTNGSLTQPTGSVVKKLGSVHRAKFVCFLPL